MISWVNIYDEWTMVKMGKGQELSILRRNAVV